MLNWNMVRCSRNCISRFKNLHSQRNHFLSSSFFFFFFSSSIDEGRTDQAANPVRPAPPPIRVALTESAGRGVFATRRIGAGELLHTAKPLMSHPSHSAIQRVCYFCLRKPGNKDGDQLRNVSFCSEECREQAKAFHGMETKADWSAYDDYCRSNGLKYPLLVKRFACMVIAGAASADLLDILQPSSLSPQMISEMQEGFALLKRAFKEANVADEKIAFLTKQWYIGVLARIRINAFRIELAGGLYEDLLLEAAASVEAEAAVGNAVYMLPSFYNHDCGEELRICYIDASMDHDARQTFLSEGFGFHCTCPRCLSGD